MARRIEDLTESMRPHMKFCSQAQLYKLHNAALQILERTGLEIHCKEALELLGDIGCGEFNELYSQYEAPETATMANKHRANRTFMNLILIK